MNFKSLILGGEEVKNWKLSKKSPDGKWLKAEDETIFSTTNLKNAAERGQIEFTSDNEFKMVKGRTFVNNDGVTLFTEKAETKVSF